MPQRFRDPHGLARSFTFVKSTGVGRVACRVSFVVQRAPHFETERLRVADWRVLAKDDLAAVAMGVLTDAVTAALPPDWGGVFDVDRARDWISSRETEGFTLLVSLKDPGEHVGFLFLFEDESDGETSMRLGYLLRESSWGRGIGSELISGLVHWCREDQLRSEDRAHTEARVHSLVGGVARTNVASARVLEKNGFVLVSGGQGDEDLFERRL